MMPKHATPSIDAWSRFDSQYAYANGIAIMYARVFTVVNITIGNGARTNACSLIMSTFSVSTLCCTKRHAIRIETVRSKSDLTVLRVDWSIWLGLLSVLSSGSISSCTARGASIRYSLQTLTSRLLLGGRRFLSDRFRIVISILVMICPFR